MSDQADLLADLNALLAPYGTGPRAMWQLFTDRPDVAEAVLATGRAEGVPEDDPALQALAELVEAQREAAAAGQAAAFRLVDPDGHAEAFVPGVSPN